MRQTNTLVLPGQPAFEILKDLSGGAVIRISSESVKLSPRQAHDAAIALLRVAGVEVNVTAKRADDLGGEPLKAKIRIA